MSLRCFWHLNPYHNELAFKIQTLETFPLQNTSIYQLFNVLSYLYTPLKTVDRQSKGKEIYLLEPTFVGRSSPFTTFCKYSVKLRGIDITKESSTGNAVISQILLNQQMLKCSRTSSVLISSHVLPTAVPSVVIVLDSPAIRSTPLHSWISSLYRN